MGRRRSAAVYDDQGVTVVDLGRMEIWDGADLALLRETLTELCLIEGCRSFGIDMASVKYVPSGFFGMLGDWERRGVSVRLYAPQPRVRNMLWFRQFMEAESEDCFRLLKEPKHSATPTWTVPWQEREMREMEITPIPVLRTAHCV
jgi:hypothetical protein